MIDKFVPFLEKIRHSDFKGYSVYDCFNSPIINKIQYLNINLLNIAITQLFKRCPVNIRHLFFTEKSINPKALGLILKGKLLCSDTSEQTHSIIQKIFALRSEKFQNLCWGYNWDYYTLRGGKFAKFYPNSIVTFFIGDALIDFYVKYPSEELKANLLSINSFFINDIHRTERAGGICFSYSPSDRKEIYNASALVSLYLFRIFKLFNVEENLNLVKLSIKYLIDRQNEDASWYYGYNKKQKWVDSFHTEYILEFFNALDEQLISAFGFEYKLSLANAYYLHNFIKEDRLCNYYPDRIYPINIHSVASRLIYLCKSQPEGHMEEIWSLLTWTYDNLYDKKSHDFYFEKRKHYTNRNKYFRWNQAWMYLALMMIKSRLALCS